jgi:hypothetical protein
VIIASLLKLLLAARQRDVNAIYSAGCIGGCEAEYLAIIGIIGIIGIPVFFANRLHPAVNMSYVYSMSFVYLRKLQT